MEWSWLPDGLFFRGLVLGIALTLMVGPITLTILRYGMLVHPVSGFWVAAGTWISDLVFIVATYLLTQTIVDELTDPVIKQSVYIGGGLGLCLIAILLFRQKKIDTQQTKKSASSGIWRGIVAGFAVNSFSPFTFFFWLGSSVWLHSTGKDGLPFFMGIMLAIMTGDTLKAIWAPKLAVYAGNKISVIIRVLTSLMVGVMGVWAIIQGILNNVNDV